MELRGLEPLTFRLPAERSGQLSYSPFDVEVVSKVNACPLVVRARVTHYPVRGCCGRAAGLRDLLDGAKRHLQAPRAL